MNLLSKGIGVLSILKDAGFEAFIVGGAVRDLVLGKEPSDIDICSNALPQEVMNLFAKNYPSGIKFGTITVFHEDEEFEVTTFRREGEYKDGRRPESILFGDSLEEDLSRRDLTINSLAMNCNGEIIDMFGGLNDIEDKIIRTVGDPSERFSEDALRILRAFRFAARLGFSIEGKTIEGMVENKEILSIISRERVTDELLKILKTKNVNAIMHQMYNIGVFDVILKDLTLLFNVEQNNPYHIYNLSTHTFKSVEMVKDTNNLKLAMLLHDIGKPTVKQTIDGHDIFYNHNKISVEIADNLLSQLNLSNKDKAEILEVIYFHDREINVTKKSVRKLINKFEHINIETLIDAKIADILSQNPKYRHRLMDCTEILEISKSETKITTKDLDINGFDLLGMGFKGCEIGNSLNFLLEKVIDEPELNEKDKLISMLRLS